ncbi:MAG: gliding motility-associated C-terminal domain-containing protein [Paludibacteraceae bacterium]|nr:gliding motility-associated C-terminal domain-containing protein [Paludibacteraceae bacterium]
MKKKLFFATCALLSGGALFAAEETIPLAIDRSGQQVELLADGQISEAEKALFEEKAIWHDVAKTAETSIEGCDEGQDTWAVGQDRAKVYSGNDAKTDDLTPIGRWAVFSLGERGLYFVVEVYKENPSNHGGETAQGNQSIPNYAGDAVEVYTATAAGGITSTKQYGFGYAEPTAGPKNCGAAAGLNNYSIERVAQGTASALGPDADKLGWRLEVILPNPANTLTSGCLYEVAIAQEGERSVLSCNDNKNFGMYGRRVLVNTSSKSASNYKGLTSETAIKGLIVPPVEPEDVVITVVNVKSCKDAEEEGDVDNPTGANGNPDEFITEEEAALLEIAGGRQEIKFTAEDKAKKVNEGDRDNTDYCRDGSVDELAGKQLAWWQLLPATLNGQDGMWVYAVVSDPLAENNASESVSDQDWKANVFEFYVVSGEGNNATIKQYFIREGEESRSAHFGQTEEVLAYMSTFSLGVNPDFGYQWAVKFFVPAELIAGFEDGSFFVEAVVDNFRPGDQVGCVRAQVYTFNMNTAYNVHGSTVGRVPDVQQIIDALKAVSPTFVIETIEEEIHAPEPNAIEDIVMFEGDGNVAKVTFAEDEYEHIIEYVKEQEQIESYVWTINQEEKDVNADTYKFNELAVSENPYAVTVTATNKEGCSGTVAFNVTVKQHPKFPNAIDLSENGIADGSNTFAAERLGTKLYIFNRVGMEVYSEKYSENTPFKGWNGGWDNDDSKLVSPGVYFYVIEAEDGTHKGTIEVVNPK